MQASVITDGGEVLAIRREGDGVEGVFPFWLEGLENFPGFEGPKPDRAILAGGGEAGGIG